MVRRGWIVFRIIGAIVLVVLVVAAVGLAYQAGMTQGYAQAAIQPRSSGSQTAPVYPFYPWFAWPHFGFFPIFPLFGFFFLGLLFLFALRALFRPWHWGYYGRWHGHPHDWGTPPWAKNQPEGKSEPETQMGEEDKRQG